MDRIEALEKKIEILHACLRCLVDELSDNELLDRERLKHNTRELTTYPISLQRLK